MSQRVMNALGASELVRTICATAGIAGVTATHGVSPEVDPEEWPHARYLLLWGWNPMSTAPHLWRILLETQRSGARLVVVDPFRSKTARLADEHLRPLPGTDAALALGMMRAIRDAGSWTRTGAAPTPPGYDELLERLDEWPLDRAAEVTGVPATDIERVGLDFARTQPALLRLGVGAQRHVGAPAAYSTVASLPALVGAWRHRGGGCSYIPTATAAAISRFPAGGPTCGRSRPGASTCPSSETRCAATSTRRSPRSSCGTRTRPRSPPIRRGCSRGSSAPTSSPSSSSSS